MTRVHSRHGLRSPRLACHAGRAGPEGLLHTHDYRLELIVESKQLRGQGWM